MKVLSLNLASKFNFYGAPIQVKDTEFLKNKVESVCAKTRHCVCNRHVSVVNS